MYFFVKKLYETNKKSVNKKSQSKIKKECDFQYFLFK